MGQRLLHNRRLNADESIAQSRSDSLAHRAVEAEGSANAGGAQGRFGPSDETFAVPQPSHHASRSHSRSGTAHSPSPDDRCGPPGLSLSRKSAALRLPWLRWPPTPAPGARAAPPRTSIRKGDGGESARTQRVMEAEGSANFSSAPIGCGQVTKPAPSRSRGHHGSPLCSSAAQRQDDAFNRQTNGRWC